MMRSIRRCCSSAVALLLLVSAGALAQGSLQDYQRAQQFLPGNVRDLVYVADVSPHWIEKTKYRRVD